MSNYEKKLGSIKLKKLLIQIFTLYQEHKYPWLDKIIGSVIPATVLFREKELFFSYPRIKQYEIPQEYEDTFFEELIQVMRNEHRNRQLYAYNPSNEAFIRKIIGLTSHLESAFKSIDKHNVEEKEEVEKKDVPTKEVSSQEPEDKSQIEKEEEISSNEITQEPQERKEEEESILDTIDPYFEAGEIVSQASTIQDSSDTNQSSQSTLEGEISLEDGASGELPLQNQTQASVSGAQVTKEGETKRDQANQEDSAEKKTLEAQFEIEPANENLDSVADEKIEVEVREQKANQNQENPENIIQTQAEKKDAEIVQPSEPQTSEPQIAKENPDKSTQTIEENISANDENISEDPDGASSSRQEAESQVIQTESIQGGSRDVSQSIQASQEELSNSQAGSIPQNENQKQGNEEEKENPGAKSEVSDQSSSEKNNEDISIPTQSQPTQVQDSPDALKVQRPEPQGNDAVQGLNQVDRFENEQQEVNPEKNIQLSGDQNQEDLNKDLDFDIENNKESDKESLPDSIQTKDQENQITDETANTQSQEKSQQDSVPEPDQQDKTQGNIDTNQSQAQSDAASSLASEPKSPLSEKNQEKNGADQESAEEEQKQLGGSNDVSNQAKNQNNPQDYQVQTNQVEDNNSIQVPQEQNDQNDNRNLSEDNYKEVPEEKTQSPASPPLQDEGKLPHEIDQQENQVGNEERGTPQNTNLDQALQEDETLNQSNLSTPSDQDSNSEINTEEGKDQISEEEKSSQFPGFSTEDDLVNPEKNYLDLVSPKDNSKPQDEQNKRLSIPAEESKVDAPADIDSEQDQEKNEDIFEIDQVDQSSEMPESEKEDISLPQEAQAETISPEKEDHIETDQKNQEQVETQTKDEKAEGQPQGNQEKPAILQNLENQSGAEVQNYEIGPDEKIQGSLKTSGNKAYDFIIDEKFNNGEGQIQLFRPDNHDKAINLPLDHLDEFGDLLNDDTPLAKAENPSSEEIDQEKEETNDYPSQEESQTEENKQELDPVNPSISKQAPLMSQDVATDTQESGSENNTQSELNPVESSIPSTSPIQLRDEKLISPEQEESQEETTQDEQIKQEMPQNSHIQENIDRSEDDQMIDEQQDEEANANASGPSKAKHQPSGGGNNQKNKQQNKRNDYLNNHSGPNKDKPHKTEKKTKTQQGGGALPNKKNKKGLMGKVSAAGGTGYLMHKILDVDMTVLASVSDNLHNFLNNIA